MDGGFSSSGKQASVTYLFSYCDFDRSSRGCRSNQCDLIYRPSRPALLTKLHKTDNQGTGLILDFFSLLYKHMSLRKKKMERNELFLWLPRQLKLLRTVGFSESQASLLGGRQPAPSLLLLAHICRPRKGFPPFPCGIFNKLMLREGSSWFLWRKGYGRGNSAIL